MLQVQPVNENKWMKNSISLYEFIPRFLQILYRFPQKIPENLQKIFVNNGRL